MTSIDPQLLEQLSAWMDGELPADEARFLQRRLANDVALRDQWERWQVASACLKQVPVRAMDPGLADRIAVAIAPATAVPSQRPRVGWFASAAALVLAAVMLPGILAVDPQVAQGDDLAESRPVPSPPLDTLAASSAPMSPLPSVRDYPLVIRSGQAWPRSPLPADASAPAGLVVRDSVLLAPPGSVAPAPPAREAGDDERPAQ